MLLNTHTKFLMFVPDILLCRRFIIKSMAITGWSATCAKKYPKVEHMLLTVKNFLYLLLTIRLALIVKGLPVDGLG